ncbi:nitroreductase family protein [Propionivibrio sp.]|uniref:nitroreductase family protein n=1 Tax=Propionivibrio sp. TaxID=2212460 RepID=UPI0025F6ABC4|nr:nitroreductase family protein [Propionivibrio sp.]
METRMTRDILLQILDLARWAPSGDNTQPWRFELVADDHLAIHGHDTRDHVLYDFDGHASQMAHGAFLETLRLAATRYGLAAKWQIRAGQPDTAPIYDVKLRRADIPEDPLVPFITTRTVQRRAMSATRLLPTQKDALIAAVGNDHTLQFFESFTDRLAVARLLWNNAYIRLTCPEAYPVHRDIIEWNARFSADRIPDQAVGTDPLTTKLMHWVMQSWGRVVFFNRFLGGTIVPRLQLDFAPALACAGHVLMKPAVPPSGLAARIEVGVALQRLWLTTAALGLQLQPEMTPVIFRWYARSSRTFSTDPAIAAGTRKLATQFEAVAGAGPSDAFSFFCRIGESPLPSARSTRKSLPDLAVD